MRFLKTTICALAFALSVGVTGCDDTKHEAVTFHEEGCSFHNYYFTFQDNELISVNAPCVDGPGSRTCFYTPGNKKQCKNSGRSREVSSKTINKYLWIYDHGQKW